MKPFTCIILLLVLSQCTTTRKLNKDIINKLEEKLARFLTHDNDVVHMKILFDNKPEQIDRPEASKARRLTVRSPLDDFSSKYLNLVRRTKKDQPKQKRNYISVYKFKNSAEKTLRPDRKLSKARNVFKRSNKRRLDDIADNSFKARIEEMANSFDITSTSDALMAGAGTAALLYGVHSKHSNTKKRTKVTMAIQQSYLYKKSYNEQLGIEVKSLKLLADGIDELNRKTTSTQEIIGNNIDNKIMFGGSEDI